MKRESSNLIFNNISLHSRLVILSQISKSIFLGRRIATPELLLVPFEKWISPLQSFLHLFSSFVVQWVSRRKMIEFNIFRFWNIFSLLFAKRSPLQLNDARFTVFGHVIGVVLIMIFRFMINRLYSLNVWVPLRFNNRVFFVSKCLEDFSVL